MADLAVLMVRRILTGSVTARRPLLLTGRLLLRRLREGRRAGWTTVRLRMRLLRRKKVQARCSRAQFRSKQVYRQRANTVERTRPMAAGGDPLAADFFVAKD